MVHRQCLAFHNLKSAQFAEQKSDACMAFCSLLCLYTMCLTCHDEQRPAFLPVALPQIARAHEFSRLIFFYGIHSL